MSKFIVGTGGRIYDPIIVEINGKQYTARNITRELNRKLRGAEPKKDEPGTETIDKVYQQIEILLGPEVKEDLETLDLDEASDILIFITNQYGQKRAVDKPNIPAPIDGEAQESQGKN